MSDEQKYGPAQIIGWTIVICILLEMTGTVFRADLPAGWSPETLWGVPLAMIALCALMLHVPLLWVLGLLNAWILYSSGAEGPSVMIGIASAICGAIQVNRFWGK